MYFFKSYLPNAKLKLPRKQRTILPILPEVRTQFFPSFFFSSASLCTAFVCLAATTGRLLSVRSVGGGGSIGVGILLFVFSRLPSPISPVSSLCLYTLDRILFLSPIANVGILCFTVTQLSLFCLLLCLPSTTNPQSQPRWFYNKAYECMDRHQYLLALHCSCSKFYSLKFKIYRFRKKCNKPTVLQFAALYVK